jgi:hypothetical protein
MAPKRRGRGGWIAVGILAVVVLVAGAVAITWSLAQPDLPTKSGIEAPHADCESDIENLSHPWIKDGWWAGYVNGEKREMVASDAAALSQAGHNMHGVWLCPPKSTW